MSVDQFIAEFNARLDIVACLGFDDNVKGNLLLKLSGLGQSDQNIVMASSGVYYEVKKMSTALRSAYQHLQFADASMYSPGYAPNQLRVTHSPQIPPWTVVFHQAHVHASNTPIVHGQ